VRRSALAYESAMSQSVERAAHSTARAVQHIVARALWARAGSDAQARDVRYSSTHSLNECPGAPHAHAYVPLYADPGDPREP